MSRGDFLDSIGDFMSVSRLAAVLAGLLAFTLLLPALLAQAVIPPRRAVARPAVLPAGAAPAANPEKKPDDATKDEASIDVPRQMAEPLPPQYMRLHLLDGSVIGGDLSMSEITVETPFGKLVVPID